jgi:DNA-binding protein H-NS
MPRQAALKLNAMTVAELMTLREEVLAALSEKIRVERAELQRKMDELSQLDRPAAAGEAKRPRRGRKTRVARSRTAKAESGNGGTHPLKGRTVAAKYRDPANPEQTWAGRGQAPRWLAAYESQGRSRDEFRIADEGRAAGKGRGKASA